MRQKFRAGKVYLVECQRFKQAIFSANDGGDQIPKCVFFRPFNIGLVPAYTADRILSNYAFL
jgi:hypothetical protein